MTWPGTTASVPLTGDAARLALRTVASGVTVLTVIHDGVRHGVTVSAVIAVSRDPLILGVCLRPASAFGAAVRQVGWFSVNVLASGQEEVARQFATPGRPIGNAQFFGLQWTTDQLTSAPLIRGCVGHLACRAQSRHRVGDHDLLLAEVLGGQRSSGTPLLTFAGRLQSAALTSSSQHDPGYPNEVS